MVKVPDPIAEFLRAKRFAVGVSLSYQAFGWQSVLRDHGIQSAINTLISCETFALRLETNTSFLPSGENCGKALKPPANVTRSRPVPSRSMA